MYHPVADFLIVGHIQMDDRWTSESIDLLRLHVIADY
jgi:hypothetical protein